MIKKIIFKRFPAAFLMVGCLAAIACGIDFDESEPVAAQKGYVTGSVTNSQGNPLEGVRIIIDHSIFFNSNLSTATDANGKYRIKIPIGSWYAYAQIKKSYNGKVYNFDLQPDSYSGFGGEGAVRNFVWTLTGKKEEPLAQGFFGGLITFDNFPTGNYIQDENEIEFTLRPVGNLIDGTAGETLKLRSEDGYKLSDVPIGKYEISASYRGKSLKIRKWRTEDEFATTLRADFEPQITPQCENCLMLEYYF